jgi:hypothetical protein
MTTAWLLFGLVMGCNSPPPKPAELTEEVLRQIEQQDAMVQELESQQRT